MFPDHVVGRITAVAALASLIGRDRAGTGAHVHISQAEAAVNQLAASYVIDAAKTAALPVADDPALHAVFPCEGEDEWCVISLRGDADRKALATAMGSAALPENRADLVEAISAWTLRMDKVIVAETLQRRGVPAAPMNRAVDVLADPTLVYRKFFTDMVHPLFDQADAHRDQPVPVRPHPAGRTASRTAGRRAHPRDLPEAAGAGHR